jgi:hypothetical protein
MGFLSKLFGGDAGSASGKTAAEPASSAAQPEGGAAPGVIAANEVAATPPREAAAVATPGAAVVARGAAPAPNRKPVLTGEHRADAGLDTPVRAGRAANLVETAKNPKAAARAPRATEPKPPPAVLQEPTAASPTVPRRAPESPRRAAQVESSIITSAPALGAEPHRPPMAPRPAGGVKPARPAPDFISKPAGEPPKPPADPARAAVATEPGTPHRAPMASVTGEAGLLGSGRRKDRSKSPGFYSNMAPAYGAQVVNPGASQSIKRTAIGLAPPPDAVAAELGAAEPDAAESDAAESIVAETNAEKTGEAALDGAADVAPALAANDAAPASAMDDEASALPDSAPPLAATDDLEKEETAPGVGHMPSRHDPAVRNEIPERDLDLLLHFVMDLTLGLASEAWLPPVREAVGRLKAVATKLQRGALDKALSQFGTELEAPNVLAEERRARLAQQLVLVDLALPRPMDVSGQRLLRERLIVQHVLSELSVAHPLIAQRLRDEGTLTLERFARLGAEELAEKAGLSSEQADQALFAFREYLLERARRGPEAWLVGKAQALEQRLLELEASAQSFETVADADDVQAKREARRKRQADIARVSLFLAEWGEAGILGEFERSSVQGKIARLRRWLTELPAS